MNDRDIRTILKTELIRKYGNDDNTLILDELGIKHGAARIDLVVVNHRLHGYEIKSDRDSLKRLPEQIEAYSSVMDRVTLIVGYRHAYEALKMAPEWWGVRLAEEKEQNGTVVLSDARAARNNPKVDLTAAVTLLWRNEALSILEEIGMAFGLHSKPRNDIYKRLVELNDPDFLRLKIRQQLRARKEWRVSSQQMSCGD
jgi:hypothetical protein